MRRESLHRIATAPRTGAAAMVGVAPPAKSGIAIFNQAILTGLAAELDFFGDFSTIDEVRRMAEAVGTAPSLVRVFSDSAFSEALASNAYRTAIFVLGNSDQNVFALRASRLAEAAGIENILFYAHDPFLFNLYLGDLGANPGRFRKEMLAAYGGEALQERAIDALGWPPDLREFFRNEWLMWRPLFRGHKISGVIVNSTAARELIAAECGEMIPPDAIHVLFHPILPSLPTAPAANSGKSVLRIGTFGIPDPVKRTERILQAWRKLKQSFPDTELVLAGYYASAYTAENSLDPNERGLHIVDSPSEEQLLNLMASVDVAVQLRAENRGESSGTVHQLLGLRRRVIVSAHGSYGELGDAVVHIPPDASETMIAETILKTAKDDKLSERAAAYAKAHSLETYQREFCALLDNLRA